MTDWVNAPLVKPPDDIRSLIGGHPIVVQTIFQRGITEPQAALGFLDPDYYQPSLPNELPGVTQAIPLINRAIEENQGILVWGDFDVDGQTATTLLVSGLKRLGAQVFHYIPERARESHGVHPGKLQSILEQMKNPGLIITCDTGISAHEAVDLAISMGFKVVVTDHHQLPPKLPGAHAIVTPRFLSPSHQLFTLPGVGVAYKLLEGLYCEHNISEELSSFLDLVSLGIVADVAELTGDTRYLLQKGLLALRNTQRLGLQLLMEQAELNTKTITSDHIAFSLAPRLNALGRLSNANIIVEFLTTNDRTLARLTAMELEKLNARRKLLTDQVFDGALSLISRQPENNTLPVLVLNHPEWPSSVIGIVASRLVELYHKPVILIASPPGEIARGSARSVAGIDITEAIGSQANLLEGYGGHPMAGGLGIPPENLEEFKLGVAQYITKQMQTKGNLQPPTITIADWVKFSDISLEFVNEINRLAPFGSGNPPLIFAAKNLRLESQRQVGRYQEHRILKVVDDSNRSQDVVWWQGASYEIPEEPFDLAFSIQSSNFLGKEGVQFTWLEARAAEEKISLPALSTKKVLIDYRNVNDPEKIIIDLSDQPSTTVWCEGETCPSSGNLDRHHLPKASTLVVWTIPPSRVVLLTAIRDVDPQTVIFFGMNPKLDISKAFISRLAGLVKFTLNHKEGKSTLSRFACLTSQTTSTVQLGLAWLEAQGNISTIYHEDGEFQLQKGFSRDIDALKEIERLLTLSLAETAAFRTYYLRADLTHLVE